jgi:UDP-GlcNAc:undecaprenyl-phosphate GlcNAc-1-phosphate transferase
MNTFIAFFVAAMSVSLLLTPMVRRICERYSFLDLPQERRRLHLKAVPRLGGVAIFATVACVLSALPFVDNLLTQTLKRNSWQILALAIPATLVFLLGVYDDLRGSKARLKFVVQGIAAALFYALGGRIVAISVLFVGSVQLPPWLSFSLTMFWIIAITNAFNLIDGMDGLAAGSALFGSLVILVVSLVLGNMLVSIIALVLSGALIGFLRYNFNPASIFMGDSGSLFIGFLLAALSVLGTQKASTAIAVAIPILAFALPIVDTGLAICRRFVSRRPLFQADNEHIHHMLLARGWSQRRVAALLYCVCALFGLLALIVVSDAERTTGLVLFVVAMAVLLGIGRLQYHEVDEVKASIRRNVAERHLRAANHIRIRRASRSLAKATSLSELFNAVSDMLELSEFVYAKVQLGHCDDALRNQHALAREHKVGALRTADLRKGLISWSWERGDIGEYDVIGSRHFWSLRLPLSTGQTEWGYINLYRELESDPILLDISYLCNLFQREMAQAAERVLGADLEQKGLQFVRASDSV